MALTLDEKIDILNSYSKLRKGAIKPYRINYYHNNTKNKRKVVVRELRESGNGYIYVGYLEKYKDKSDNRGFINIDKHITNEIDFRELIYEVITSFE